jgi:hypothetical protein
VNYWLHLSINQSAGHFDPTGLEIVDGNFYWAEQLPKQEPPSKHGKGGPKAANKRGFGGLFGRRVAQKQLPAPSADESGAKVTVELHGMKEAAPPTLANTSAASHKWGSGEQELGGGAREARSSTSGSSTPPPEQDVPATKQTGGHTAGKVGAWRLEDINLRVGSVTWWLT